MSVTHILQTLLWGYPVPPEMMDPRYPLWLQTSGGLVLTLAITGASLCAGAVLGLCLALLRGVRPEGKDPGERFAAAVVRHGATGVVELVRGLPVMVWVLLVFYLPFRLTGWRIPGVVLGIGAFSIYSGVYMCEIIRAGLRAVEPGWIHAARVLGLSRSQRLRRIESPLLLRTMLPDIVNLAITVFKDSSVLAVVGVAELTYTGRQMQMSEPVQYGTVLLVTLVMYWVVSTATAALARVRGVQELTSS
ncbi:MAG TPA: amino acid ABC transporter permease [Planctomycetota bacterium]|jgi:His/Glu/Gln/Arg/opine family amino acid ABC transporter permease subunit